MPRVLAWTDDEHFTIGGTKFVAMRADAAKPTVCDDEFFVFKPRPLIDQYAALIEELEPQHVFELGFFAGGSTLLFAQLGRPRRVVNIDWEPMSENRAKLERHAAATGLDDVIRTFGDVDQADRARLAGIVADEFGGGPLDLVVDDCSHLYEPSLASFNELFPRLRPGGVYVIEDWRWAHTPVGEEPLEGLNAGKVPLTRLLFEIALAIPGAPGIVEEISVEKELALVRRGEAEVDPGGFDLTACTNPRGRALLST
jgi:SAM-dependent methyltransferase